jgi:riboflavin transporter FmnP
MALNVYLYIPFYSNFYGIPMEGLLSICQMANPAIKDVGWSYAVLAVLPFNALKDAIVIVLTFLVYRSIHVFLRFNKNN